MKTMLAVATVLAGCGAADAERVTREAADMSSTPALSDVNDLIGTWRLEGEAGPCLIDLASDDAPLAIGSLAAPMMAVRVRRGCTELAGLGGWRPNPSGLDLNGADGFALATFERTGPDQYRSIDQRWRMTRG